MPAALKVIDAHARLGECCVFGLVSTEEELTRRMDENGIDATVVQPYPGARNAAKTRDRIAELCARSYIEAGFSAGASGYVVKSKMISELLPAIQTVLAGKEYGRLTA